MGIFSFIRPINRGAEWQRFTDRARAVVALANIQAHARQAAGIGEEHLLAAIAEEGHGVGATILRHRGVQLEKFQLPAMTPTLSDQGHNLSKLPLELSVTNAVQRAIDEAIGLGDDYVGTEHLVLGLARGNSETMTRELAACGSTPDGLRTALRALRSVDDARQFLAAGECRRAIEAYRRALQISPQERLAANGLAWLLATCPERDLRSGNEALQLMDWVISDNGKCAWQDLVTVAAAYAEIGQFEQAVKWGTRALELTTGSDQVLCEKWLADFRKQQPIRQDASTHRK